jgi:hypothetical protein
MQAIPYIFAAVAAGSKIYGGIQQQKMYNFQAEQTRLQGEREALKGRITALNYNNQALDILKNQRRFYAAVNARAAAGGVLSQEGSAAEVAFQQGVQSSRDFDISRENAIQSLNAGLEAQLASGVQADIYRSAGKAAMTSALFDAAIGSVFAFKAGKDLMSPSTGGGSPFAPIEERSIGYGMES